MVSNTEKRRVYVLNRTIFSEEIAWIQKLKKVKEMYFSLLSISLEPTDCSKYGSWGGWVEY
jgi:hypothetical protein